MLTDKDLKNLKELLEKNYQWPSNYVFKFIVPQDKVPNVEALFPTHTFSLKKSSKGRFVGMTVDITLDSPEVVVAIYQKASLIPGLISI